MNKNVNELFMPKAPIIHFDETVCLWTQCEEWVAAANMRAQAVAIYNTPEMSVFPASMTVSPRAEVFDIYETAEQFFNLEEAPAQKMSIDIASKRLKACYADINGAVANQTDNVVLAALIEIFELQAKVDDYIFMDDGTSETIDWGFDPLFIRTALSLAGYYSISSFDLGYKIKEGADSFDYINAFLGCLRDSVDNIDDDGDLVVAMPSQLLLSAKGHLGAAFQDPKPETEVQVRKKSKMGLTPVKP